MKGPFVKSVKRPSVKTRLILLLLLISGLTYRRLRIQYIITGFAGTVSDSFQRTEDSGTDARFVDESVSKESQKIELHDRAAFLPPLFRFPPHLDQFRRVRQVVQGVGPVPELMLLPHPRRYREEEEPVDVRAPGRDVVVSADRESASVRFSARICCRRDTPLSSISTPKDARNC